MRALATMAESSIAGLRFRSGPGSGVRAPSGPLERQPRFYPLGLAAGLGRPEGHLAQFVVKAAFEAADEVPEFRIEQEPLKLVVQMLELLVEEPLAHAEGRAVAVDHRQQAD